jgi:hypothetical protein
MRAEVEQAFTYSTSLIVGKAVWLDASRGAIVITSGPLILSAMAGLVLYFEAAGYLAGHLKP